MMNEIRELLLNARQRMAVQVNTELLSTYWNVGKIIVEHEQENKDRADYGKQTLKELSKELTKEFGKGFSVSNLQFMRRFYQSYQIQQTVSVKLSWSHYCELLTISDPDKRSFSKGSVRRIAQPIKFNIPNQIICAGMATNVIIEISSPKRLNMIPRRKFFSFPHTHTKPEIKMNVQHIACCQIWIAGRLYHVGDFSYTIYTSYKK